MLPIINEQEIDL